MKLVEFEVYGQPQPKGSTRAFARLVRGRPVAAVTSDNRNLKTWAALVADVAQKHAKGTFFAAGEPVYVLLRFAVQRPQSLPKRVLQPTKKPDLDKLARAILDALTGTIVHDDAQVVDLRCVKRYAAFDEPPSVYVQVAELRS